MTLGEKVTELRSDPNRGITFGALFNPTVGASLITSGTDEVNVGAGAVGVLRFTVKDAVDLGSLEISEDGGPLGAGDVKVTGIKVGNADVMMSGELDAAQLGPGSIVRPPLGAVVAPGDLVEIALRNDTGAAVDLVASATAGMGSASSYMARVFGNGYRPERFACGQLLAIPAGGQQTLSIAPRQPFLAEYLLLSSDVPLRALRITSISQGNKQLSQGAMAASRFSAEGFSNPPLGLLTVTNTYPLEITIRNTSAGPADVFATLVGNGL